MTNEDGADIGDGLYYSTTPIRTESNEVHVEYQVMAASAATQGAELYIPATVSDHGRILVDGGGHYEGVTTAAAGGSRVQGGVFIREANSNGMWDYKSHDNGLDVDLDPVDGWAGNGTWNASTITSDYYSPGDSVEIGVRFKTHATAITTSSALVDFHTEEFGSSGQVAGFFDFSWMSFKMV